MGDFLVGKPVECLHHSPDRGKYTITGTIAIVHVIKGVVNFVIVEDGTGRLIEWAMDYYNSISLLGAEYGEEKPG